MPPLEASPQVLDLMAEKHGQPAGQLRLTARRVGPNVCTESPHRVYAAADAALFGLRFPVPRSTTSPLPIHIETAPTPCPPALGDDVDAYIDGLVAEMQEPAVAAAMDAAFERLVIHGGAALNLRRSGHRR
jgi:hypothetical protein